MRLINDEWQAIEQVIGEQRIDLSIVTQTQLAEPFYQIALSSALLLKSFVIESV